MKPRPLRRVARPLSRLAILGLLLLPVSQAADPPVTTDEDGLARASVKGVDRVRQLPGTDWSSYGKVLVAPVEVSFSKSWNPRDYGGFGLAAADVDRIRRELSKMAYETFARVLGEGGYTVVQQPAEGVLQVQANIVNLYINAPDTMSSGRARTYVLNPGEMTLALELRDSITGTLLAEARDRKRGADQGFVTLSNRAMNRVEAERALRGWAAQLKNALDAARSPR